MKFLSPLALMLPLLLLGLPLRAQEPAETAAERARISTERGKAEATFTAQEKACYGKFAVNDCIAAARAQRREALADLRRQEVGLNDLERKRKAAERLREIDARRAEQAREATQAQPQPVRLPEAKPRLQPAAPAKSEAGKKPDVSRTEPDKRENLRRYQARLEEAQDHKDKVAKRAAERKKAAQPLPAAP